MMRTIDPNICACSNYVKREGEIFKVMCEQSEDDSNMMGETEVNNNQTQNPEEVIMQIDGLDDSFNEDEVTDATESDGVIYTLDSKDDDVSRSNIFTSRYLDNMSETTSVSSLPSPRISSTQDYLDSMSESEASSVPVCLNEGLDDEFQSAVLDSEGLEARHHQDRNEVATRYIKANVSVSEGKRVFKVVIEKEIQEEFCFFPNGHQDLREMREFGTYRGYPIGSLLPAPVHTGTRSGRTQQGINVLLNSEDIIKEVEIKIKWPDKAFESSTVRKSFHT